MEPMENIQLSEEQRMEMNRLKDSFPCRIVYMAIHPETKECRSGAVYNKREPKNYAKNGWQVWLLGA